LDARIRRDKMKYVAARLAAVVTSFAAIFVSTFLEEVITDPIGWGSFDLSPRIGVLNGSLSFIAAIAAFWLIVTRLKRATAVRERKMLAARARA
jgi:hypothetical protein